MTTDFDDADLERSLTRHGSEFRNGLAAPDLTAMVQHAIVADRPNHRWAWPLLAAVLLLAIPLVTVLALHRSTGSPATSTATNDPSLPLLGDALWSDAVLQPGGKSIAVLVDVNRTPGNYCLDEGPPVLKPVVTETSATVHIEVKAYRPGPVSTPSVPAGATYACSDVGLSPVPVVATLTGPLDGRSVTGGTTATVLDATGFPSASYLPTGYVGSGVVVGGLGLVGNDLPHQLYVKGSAGQLSIVQGASPYEHPKTVATGTVHGQPAIVEQEGGFNDNVCLTWAEHGGSWSVCTLEGSAPALAASELFKIANGLH